MYRAFVEYYSIRPTNAQCPNIYECFKETDIVNIYCAFIEQI